MGFGVVGKGGDDVTQGREGLVDVLGLIQDSSLSTSFTHLLQKMQHLPSEQIMKNQLSVLVNFEQCNKHPIQRRVICILHEYIY